VTIPTADQATATGLIFDIQAHSVHDGPGTRTTVFLNGCPLACQWCCNPEGLHRKPVVMHRDQRCMHCGKCLEACPAGAISLGADGQAKFDRSLCADCSTHECVTFCYHEGNVMSGKPYTVDQLVAILQRDRAYWGSRGGVTFSGGEPLMQPGFLLEALGLLRAEGVHTALDTCGFAPRADLLAAAGLASLVLYDLKLMDEERHRAATGQSNRIILENLKALAEVHEEIRIRVPVIPGLNDDLANLEATADFLASLAGARRVDLLPYHRTGEAKFARLGLDYALSDLRSPTPQRLEALAAVFRDRGLDTTAGGQP